MADEYLIQINEIVEQSTVDLTDSGDSLAVNLNEIVSVYTTDLIENPDVYNVNVVEESNDFVIDVTAPTDDYAVVITEGGGGGAAGAVFITDITPVAGVVGTKVFTADGKELLSCSTDNASVRVVVAAEGSGQDYTPEVKVNDVVVTLTESSTKRWFTGTIDVAVANGLNTITATSNAGSLTTVEVNRRGAGPAITSIVIGAYPGAQTELKAGDTVTITINTEPDAVSVTIAGGSTCNSPTFAVTAGVATGTITIGAASGSVTFSAVAYNDFGTAGTAATSPALTLNQTYPTIGSFTVTYPVGQSAAKNTETVTVTSAVTNADTVNYTATGLSVDSPSVYSASKTATVTSSAYVVTGTNYTITANRAANNATSSYSTLVKLATAAPTAAITIVPSGRLVSSPAGTDYEVRITPDQQYLNTTPTLTASVGTFQGSWTNMGSYWKRNLRITDADPKGAGTFSALSVTGLSGVFGTTISSGANYTVGGISSRTLTFAAFSRVTAIGTTVADATKTSAAVVGGNTLTRQTSNAVVSNGFYIADSNGAYNPNGAYLGLSDTAFAGANTSGTLQVTFAEAA